MSAADWPTHNATAWQAVLDRACALGWPAPAWTKNHPQIKLVCPAGDPKCTIRIYSTGKGTETVAVQSLRGVERCPHRNIVGDIVRVDDALCSADRFVRAAETLIKRGEISAKLDELMQLIDESLDVAEAQMELEFDDLTTTLDSHTQEARELLDADPDAVPPAEPLQKAGQHIREAMKRLARLPKKNGDVVERKERLAVLSARREAAAARARNVGP